MRPGEPEPTGGNPPGLGAGRLLPWLRAVQTSELPGLALRAKSAGHALIAPTHVFDRAGELVGYASLAGIPLLLPWVGKSMTARDSVYLLNLMENLLAERGASEVLIPVEDGSPFRPYMAGFGYQDYGPCRVHIKKLK